jgi:alpha-L-fucosidase
MNHIVSALAFAVALSASVGLAADSRKAEAGQLFDLVLVRPEARQLAWQKLEFIAFVHFGMNTFTGRDLGTGQEDPKLFNPTELDCRQWARLSREAGARAVLLVAKHHDGFCLWPSQYTDFSVRRSPWRNGQGDLVREMAEACREHGLKLGIYLSPTDFHEPTFGTDSAGYNAYFKNQLRELLTKYGEISEVFFDGAQPTRKRQEYDWAGFYALIRELRPGAVISIKGPDVRWVGNEQGRARESEWSVIPLPVAPGAWHWPDLTAPDLGSRGQLAGGRHLHWYPAEADVSLGGYWFYQGDEPRNLKSLPQLVDIYYQSVGRNAVLLLNLSPDRRGRISDRAAQRLQELGAVLHRTFQTNLAAGAKVTASNTRTPAASHAPGGVLDGERGTFWMAEDGCGPVELVMELPRPVRFNRAMLQEEIELSQRIEAFALDAWLKDGWQEIARGTTVGYKRLLRFDAVETAKVRLRILDSRVCPTLCEFGLYLEEQNEASPGH